VLATGENYPDALTASVLAGAVGGPLLLMPEATPHPVITDELRRLQPAHAYVIGPLSATVEDAVRALGIETTRLRGAERYETAMLIAIEVSALNAEAVFVATGEGFADALAAGALAAGLGHPILLTPRAGDHRLRSWVSSLGAERVYVVGGTNAVSDAAVARLPGVERIAGPNRAATAAAIADRAVAEGYGRDPLVASGATFPDGLGGGVFAAASRRPLLVTGRDRLAPEVHAWLSRHGSTSVTILGGAAAVGPGPRCQLRTGYDRPDACD
jgi:putative cell wall-binding protein